eukprot:1160738-Pelagomonas_calceolata.AAC.5
MLSISTQLTVRILMLPGFLLQQGRSCKRCPNFEEDALRLLLGYCKGSSVHLDMMLPAGPVHAIKLAH